MNTNEFETVSNGTDGIGNPGQDGKPRQPSHTDLTIAPQAVGGPDAALTDLKTIREIAQLLRKSKGQVRRLFGEGKLPEPIYIGRTPMWPRQVIEGWIRDQIAKGGIR